MQRLQQIPRHLPTHLILDPRILPRPQMTDQLPLTLRLALRKPIRLLARQMPHTALEIVPDKRAETTLIRDVKHLFFKSRAFRVPASFFGADSPLVHDLPSFRLVLRDDEARVEVEFSGSVFVVGFVWVDGHGEDVDGGVKGEVVHDPFEGEVEVREDGVRVHEDAGGVVVEESWDENGFLPGGAATVGEGFDVDVVVLVADR